MEHLPLSGMSGTKTLLNQLNGALRLLEHRKMMIPRYCDQSKHWNGKNHYSMDDIPKIQKQIDETRAAIEGIKNMQRQSIIVITKNDLTEVWGSLTEACKKHKWPYHSIKAKKYPFEHDGWYFKKVSFRALANES